MKPIETIMRTAPVIPVIVIDDVRHTSRRLTGCWLAKNPLPATCCRMRTLREG
ncbi:hypothetical protein [Alteripontixanthobacter muriae]|uniref:hypothetical protein n=1 Tax=Alteripontixanthobacter muriae TaxID=2705546 RepID=UPI001E31D5BA|nr:hypothetical protein [Alteripontixanthobacter muriae]